MSCPSLHLSISRLGVYTALTTSRHHRGRRSCSGLRALRCVHRNGDVGHLALCVRLSLFVQSDSSLAGKSERLDPRDAIVRSSPLRRFRSWQSARPALAPPDRSCVAKALAAWTHG